MTDRNGKRANFVAIPFYWRPFVISIPSMFSNWIVSIWKLLSLSSKIQTWAICWRSFILWEILGQSMPHGVTFLPKYSIKWKMSFVMLTPFPWFVFMSTIQLLKSIDKFGGDRSFKIPSKMELFWHLTLLIFTFWIETSCCWSNGKGTVPGSAVFVSLSGSKYHHNYVTQL